MTRTTTHLARLANSGAISSRVACGRLIDTVKNRTNLLYTIRTEEVTCAKCKASVYFRSKGEQVSTESKKVMMIQRCARHPSANIILQRDGRFTCIICDTQLKTDSIDPPTNEK